MFLHDLAKVLGVRSRQTLLADLVVGGDRGRLHADKAQDEQGDDPCSVVAWSAVDEDAASLGLRDSSNGRSVTLRPPRQRVGPVQRGAPQPAVSPAPLEDIVVEILDCDGRSADFGGGC